MNGLDLEAQSADAQPLDPRLTGSEAQTEAVASPAPPSARTEPPEALAGALPSGDSERSAEEAPADSQSIGRIRLRKAEPLSAEAALERQPPRGPGSHVDAPASTAPDSPSSLHVTLDILDLDRLAERIRPMWEVPASRRVTPPGEDPEVVMHYPPEWQPPPSERRRMRQSVEVTPTLPLSLGPQTSERREDDWNVTAREPSSASAPLPPPADIPAAVLAPALPVQREAAATLDLPVAAAGSPGAGVPARDNDWAPEPDRRVVTPAALELESTAPTALSGLPARAPLPSGTKLWVAGLAAAALVALVWRGTSGPSATAPVKETTPAPAQVGDVSEALEDAPPSESDPPSRATAPSPAPASATDATSAAPAADTSIPAPATPKAPMAPVVPSPRPAPAAARPPTASPRLSPETREHPQTSEPSNRDFAASPPPSSVAEPIGPDPGQVAQALGIAAAQARACRASDGSGGSGSVRVLLNPAGGVLNVTALDSFQGTATGACVENAFRGARTPAYDGRTLSTVYPFNLIVD